jgi:hypothetical protein
MATVHRAPLVPETLVQHEVAHVIHEQRHKGQNYYCASDAEIAEALLDLFNSKNWSMVETPPPTPQAE